MVGSTGPDAQRLVREVERVQDAARRRRRDAFEVRVEPDTWREAGRADYLCKAGTLLVDDRDLPRAEAFLRDAQVGYRIADGLIGGVTLIEVDAEIAEILDRADDALGVGVLTPNHVLDVQGVAALCPAEEPEPATIAERWPQTRDGALGAGVRVAVVDTGFLRGYEHDAQLPWLAGVDRYDEDDEAYLPGDEQQIAPYGGHGTFSAGVVLSVAPGAHASVDDVLVGGVVDEATMVRQLSQALADSPDVICLSAGTYTRRNVPPKAFTAFWEHRLRHHKGVALVAAAGNNESREPFWPAAFPWALSVGALTRDSDRRTSWSNFGGWVDVYAPGEGIVNAFPAGSYRYLDGSTQDFPDRMARWSGTSFSTPMVAGLLARRMAQTGENGQEAVAALRQLAREQFLPGVGPRLLP